MEEQFIVEILIAKVAGALTALGVIAACARGSYKWCRKSVYTPAKEFKRKLVAVVNDSENVPTQLLEIKSQLVSNGGSSLRDAINRMELKTDYLVDKSRYADDAADQALFETDAENNCTYVNTRLAEMLGVEKTELMARGWLVRIKPDERARIMREWAEARENRIEMQSTQTFQHGETEEWITIRVYAKPYFDRKKNLLGFFGGVSLDEKQD